MLRRAGTDKTMKDDSPGVEHCAREKLPNTIRLIFMPEPYPCYPFNPWFFSDFQKIGVSFAAKE